MSSQIQHNMTSSPHTHHAGAMACSTRIELVLKGQIYGHPTRDSDRALTICEAIVRLEL
jgi:hypothetical protein